MALSKLITLVKTRNISPVELVQHSIQKINKIDKDINAIVSTRFEAALKEAKFVDINLPFAGIPILIKDLFCDIEGMPTLNGSKQISNVYTSRDSNIVLQLKQLGFIIIGKTNTAEYGLSSTTEPKAFGATKNPWNLKYSCGGSSGGAAASVCSGMVPLAHASDAGGSIRIPAAYCGLVGLKPSIDHTFTNLKTAITSHHVLTSSVDDCNLVLQKLRPQLFKSSAQNRPYKIGIMMEHPLHQISDECKEPVQFTVSALQSMGHSTKPISFHLNWSESINAFITIVAYNLRQQISTNKHMEAASKLMFEISKYITPSTISEATRLIAKITHQTEQLFNQFDFILSPTTAIPAPMLNQNKISLIEKIAIELSARLHCKALTTFIHNQLIKHVFSDAPFLMIYNLAGCPAISLPVSWKKEMPSSIQLAAARNNDMALLKLSKALMNKLPAIDIPASFL